MPEGPSILILKEKLHQFTGRKITLASGYAKINFSKIKNKKIVAIKTWGKHLFICLSKNIIEIHLRMFGSYCINGRKNHINPKLHLQFSGAEINFYVADVNIIESLDAYDESADIMSPQWDNKAAKSKLKSFQATMICDALLNQQIFAGVGNIIKNEALWLSKIHPEDLVSELPAPAISSLIKNCIAYAFKFLQYKKEGTLSLHWHAYRQAECSRCSGEIIKKYTGRAKRVSYFCPFCQQKR